MQDTRDLPEAILGYIAANPAGTLAARFRLYARHSIVPGMQRVSELLRAHAAVVEVPPTEWLVSKFPQEVWQFNTGELFQYIWVAHTEAWAALLEEWDTGELGSAVPRGADWFPLMALYAINDWAIVRGSERQRELIGCACSHMCCRHVSVPANLRDTTKCHAAG